ncbi:uncharacterized protein LOC110603940 [Manihot esculenta]|uniref:Uncharacterized protein n=1 Tax=Manihot esculenta TaxID=3983 RepID=A0A2C9U7S1_MANES|nr:uncharacterized protein LOC110603940 [Manihot esculenta]OAY25932.1 hypothetical protein MANES_16G007700v8 [Manihot esculenta]
MGNCCRRGSSVTVWAGDDWGSVGQEMKRSHKKHNTILERQKLLGEETGRSSTSSSCPREVKIKITKKELEELMARVELQGLSMEQAVAGLIKSGDKFEIMEMDHHHRSWKPALQSIPEVN